MHNLPQIDSELADEFGLVNETVLPEQQLWCAVLFLAIQDALGKNTIGSKDIYGLKQDTQNWFYYGSRDYRKVCELAGLDADEVQHAVLNYLTQPLAA